MPVQFSDIRPEQPQEREWWYNSLDCCVTREIHDKLAQSNFGGGTYDFERAIQGPLLDMMLRGMRIDPIHKANAIARLMKKQVAIEEKLNRLAHVVWGQDLNPRSPDQVKAFLYDHLNLPVQHAIIKGERKISANRDSLEKLEQYYIARPFIAAINMARDTSKKLGVLRTGVDSDGRMRCTYNPCGTDTGRLSSSSNVYGRGTNLQNITPELRRMFVADLGYTLVYLDGEQAESRAVGFIHGRLFQDWTYLDACEAGDLHTQVVVWVWDDREWPEDLREARKLAEVPFYLHFSYRDMAKRGGHGSNYYGKPAHMAKQIKVPQPLMERFQARYFGAFPAFPRWHKWCAHQIQTHQEMTTFLGRHRTFFGRVNTDEILRKSIAYEPQSVVGDLTNEGGYRVWRDFPLAQILLQVHDNYVFQVPNHLVDEYVPKMKKTFEVPVTSHGRTLRIPAEAKTGWNWADCEMDKPVEKRTFRDGNPDGLRKFKGAESRTRTEDPEASVLDRVLY